MFNVKSLVRLTILAFVLIIKHRQVRLVSAFGYVTVFERLQHSASRFVSVGAVRETAVLRKVEYLLEVAGKFLWLHVERAKALDAWSVYQEALRLAEWQRQVDRYHLAECGGVLTSVVRVAYLSCTLTGARHQTIDERALAHSTIATKQCYLVLEQWLQDLYPIAIACRYLIALITYGVIQIDHRLLIAAHILIQQVGLVEHQYHWHTISFGRRQKAVDKRGAGLWINHCHYQHGLVYIGSQYMALLAQVDTLANDIILAILDFCYPVALAHRHTVTHSHRIGAAYTLQAKVTLYLTINQLAIVCQDGVPAACILNNKSFQLSIINCPLGFAAWLVQELNSHNFLILGRNQFVNLLDILVVKFLQFVLSVLLQVL